MLSRLNPEHIFACASLLNISNSLSTIELIFSSCQRESHQPIHRAQLFLHQHCGTFAKRLTQDEKVVILNVELTCLNHINLRYFFFLHIIVFFYDFTEILF